ncbi:MAG: cell division protein SepF [Dermatophilus congolensis]|nr:cell division protein SepF [Dermatophilus congolensis]
MAGALQKAMVYLGLKEEVDRYDDEYYDDDYRRSDNRGEHDDRADRSERDDRVAHDRDHEPVRAAAPVAPVRSIDDDGDRRPRAVEEPTPIRRAASLAPASVSDEDEQPRHAAVTPLPRRVPVAEVVNDVEVTGVHRITTIHPRTYNEAKKVGESFREGTPVIMNLSDLDDADAKRLVDFAAGLVFGLSGSIERVTNKVFLLSPANVEVTSEDGEPRVSRSGLFNQS